MKHVKRTIGFVTAVLVLAVTGLAAQAQPQFGGTWTLDPSQSQFPAKSGGAQGQTQQPQQPPSVALLTVVEPWWPWRVFSEPSATNDCE